MIHSLLAMSCNVQTPGDGPHLCHSYSVAKILKLTKLPVDLPSYFLQVSRAAVNLVTHRMPPKTAVKIKRLENTQNERTAIPSPLPAHLVGSGLFFMTGWFSSFSLAPIPRSDGSGVEQPLHGISGRADDPAAEERGAPAVIYLPLYLVSVVSAGGLFELLDKLLLAGS